MNVEKLINISWYLNYKPYNTHSDYDLFYLRICRDIFKILKNKNETTNEMLSDENLRDMAYNITAYFEDVVNNIGFWESVKTLNREHFGKSLPFFPPEHSGTETAEENDISVNDIHYLLFLAMVSLFNSEDDYYLVDFNTPFIVESAKSIFEHLDLIEDVVITNFYEDYLDVSKLDYIGVKKIASWFTFNSYLTRIEFSKKLRKIVIKEQSKHNSSFEDIDKKIYIHSDLYTFVCPSNVTAYFPVDILAGAVIGSQQDKEDMKNLKFRPQGIFDYIKEDEDSIKFKHTDTQDEFEVLKSSFGNSDNMQVCEQWFMTLAKWRGRYNISGMSIGLTDKKTKLTFENHVSNNQQLCRKYSKAYREQIIDTATTHDKVMLEFFGDRLIAFDDGKKMEDLLNKYYEYSFKIFASKNDTPDNAKPIKQKLPNNFLSSNDVALFIEPLNSMCFILNHQSLLSALQETDFDGLPSKVIHECLEQFFSDSIEACYWIWLKEKYELPNLSKLLKAPTENMKNFEAILRIYKPQDFSALKLPRYSIIKG